MDFGPLNDAVIGTFGATYTYQASGQAEATITAIRSSGDSLDPAFHATLWFRASDLETEPMKGDVVIVPAEREIAPGTYRVADVKRDDEQGRRIGLQWVRA